MIIKIKQYFRVVQNMYKNETWAYELGLMAMLL